MTSLLSLKTIHSLFLAFFLLAQRGDGRWLVPLSPRLRLLAVLCRCQHPAGQTDVQAHKLINGHCDKNTQTRQTDRSRVLHRYQRCFTHAHTHAHAHTHTQLTTHATELRVAEPARRGRRHRPDPVGQGQGGHRRVPPDRSAAADDGTGAAPDDVQRRPPQQAVHPGPHPRAE